MRNLFKCSLWILEFTPLYSGMILHERRKLEQLSLCFLRLVSFDYCFILIDVRFWIKQFNKSANCSKIRNNKL